ncbi:MAG: type II secretion system protein GspN [Deltaproteobacteria bacterium]|nr:type II secretion system protein GspN [Deltaproteobacteria bacterium]
MNRTAQVILNLIVGLVSFVFFIVYLFPLDAMIGHYLAEIEEQTKGKQNLKIEVASIDASLIFDTVFQEFRLYQNNEEVFYAPKVSAGISLMPLISGSLNLGFLAEYRSGSVAGKVRLAEDSVVDLDIKKVSFKEITYLTRYLEEKKMPSLSGTINGSVYFSWSSDLVSKEAEVSLKIANTKISPYFVKPLNLELPALELSTGQALVEIDGGLDKGQLNLERFNIPGPDVVLDVSGNAKLNRRNQVVRVNLGGKFSLSEKLNKILPLDAMLTGQKAPDGSYPVSVSGSLASPRVKVGEMDLSEMLKF